MKRLLFLAGLLCFFCLQPVFGQTLSGSGTSSDPYRILTRTDLETFRTQVNNGQHGEGKFYKLMNNLDLSAVNWTPIGSFSSGKSFRGSFDGNGKTIYKLTISSGTDGNALFGYIDSVATVKNLILEEANVSGRSYHACLAVYNGGLITDCAVTYSKCSGAGNAGLLVAENLTTGQIFRSHAHGALTVNIATYGNSIAGGLCGTNGGNKGEVSISNCYADIMLTINGTPNSTSIKAGGIVGHQHMETKPIVNCYARGSIWCSPQFGSVGGICGSMVSRSPGMIRNCVALQPRIRTATSGAMSVSAICPDAQAQTENCYGYRDMIINTVIPADVTLARAKERSFWEGLGFTYKDVNPSNAWSTGIGGFPIFSWVGDPEIPFINGIYYIYTVRHLERFRDEVNGGDPKTGKTYMLSKERQNSFKLNKIPNWEPIGTVTTNATFNGTFLGNNCDIGYLTISNSADKQALFGCTGSQAIIKNLLMWEISVTAGYEHACLVAYNEGTVTECHVFLSTSKGSGGGGLVVGTNAATGKITKCYADIGTVTSSQRAIGGICGINNGLVRDCYAGVEMNGSSNSLGSTGGIVGYQTNTAQPIVCCYSFGNIYSGANIGGICGGFGTYRQDIRNCVTLMTSLKSGARICAAGDRIITGCYAYDSLLINGSLVTSNIQSNGINGANVPAFNIPFWKDSVMFDFVNTWVLPLDSDLLYPTPRFQWWYSSYATPTLKHFNSSEEQPNLKTSSSKTEESAPRLDQNVPNPFTGSTRIGYYIPNEVKQAELYIYNLTGQLIKRVVIDNRGEDEYTIGNNEISKGTYIYALIIDGKQIDHKKMVFVK